MISSTTPYKLAEIIRDTWPQLYRYKLHKEHLPEKLKKEKDVHT